MNGDIDLESLYYDYVEVDVKDRDIPGIYTNSLGQTFVLIPAGTFTMGSPSSELGRDSDETQHQVTLTQPFYMQTTEVTQAQWELVMGSNPSYAEGCRSASRDYKYPDYFRYSIGFRLLRQPQ